MKFDLNNDELITLSFTDFSSPRYTLGATVFIKEFPRLSGF